MTIPVFDLPDIWATKIQKIHSSSWHGHIEEAGTGSWVQTLLQAQAGASATLDSAAVHYSRHAQQSAYPEAPNTRAVSAETVKHWAQVRLPESASGSGYFSLSVSASLSTHNDRPGRDHHGWIALKVQDGREWCLHFRLRKQTSQARISQQLACGLLGIELLYLLANDQLSPEHLDRQLQSEIEIDVWQSNQGDPMLQQVQLLQQGWSPLIYLHRGIAQRYITSLRGQQVLVAKGSFNPLTRAHTALLDKALAQVSAPNAMGVFELTLNNADKGEVAQESLLHRLRMLASQDYPVVLTLTPTLLATKALFLHAQAQQVDFVCGTDLYERVLLPKYYRHSGGLDKALKSIFAHHTQLWVGSRSPETYPPLSDPISEAEIVPYLAQVHPFALEVPVSASAVRTRVAQEPALTGPWKDWVSDEVAQYILDQGLYQTTASNE